MLKKIHNSSLVDDMVRQVEESILSGEFKPGDKLPPTRKLQTILGASLGSIREALAILEQKGLIRVKKGAKGGIFIKEITTEPVAESLGLLIRQMKISPRELAEFRRTAEAGLIRLVIAKATDKQVNQLQEYLPKYEKCLGRDQEGWKEFLNIEADCRRRLITLARNKVYEAVLLPIHNNIFGYATELNPGDNEQVQEAYDDWKGLLEAVKNRDAERAVQITQDHIHRFQIHMEEGKRSPRAKS